MLVKHGCVSEIIMTPITCLAFSMNRQGPEAGPGNVLDQLDLFQLMNKFMQQRLPRSCSRDSSKSNETRKR